MGPPLGAGRAGHRLQLRRPADHLPDQEGRGGPVRARPGRRGAELQPLLLHLPGRRVDRDLRAHPGPDRPAPAAAAGRDDRGLGGLRDHRRGARQQRRALPLPADHPLRLLIDGGKLRHRLPHDRQQALDEQGLDLRPRGSAGDEPVACGDLEQARVRAQGQPHRGWDVGAAEVVEHHAVDELVADLGQHLGRLGVVAERPHAADGQRRVHVGLDVVEPGIGVAGHHLLDRQVEVGAHHVGRGVGDRVQGLDVELALGAEVVVDERAADARGARHVGHVDGLVRPVGEHAAGTVEDGGAPVLGVAARPARRGPSFHAPPTYRARVHTAFLLTLCQQAVSCSDAPRTRPGRPRRPPLRPRPRGHRLGCASP